jgi:hypothetical protein
MGLAGLMERGFNPDRLDCFFTLVTKMFHLGVLEAEDEAKTSCDAGGYQPER